MSISQNVHETRVVLQSDILFVFVLLEIIPLSIKVSFQVQVINLFEFGLIESCLNERDDYGVICVFYESGYEIIWVFSFVNLVFDLNC
jgi:hypothetical protein